VYAWRRAVAGQRGSDSRYLGQLLGTAASGMILPVSNAMTGPVASYLAELNRRENGKAMPWK